MKNEAIKLLWKVAVVFIYLCGQTYAKKETITFWQTMNDEESKTLQVIVDEYQKKFPNIEVKMQYVPFHQSIIKYKLAGTTGNAPDVMRIEYAYIQSFVKLNLLYAIDSFLKKEDLNDYMKGPFSYMLVDGKIWGLPQGVDALAFMYNKRLFNAKKLLPPKTMEELVHVGKKLIDTKKNKYALGINFSDWYWLYPFTRAFGGSWYDMQTMKITVASPESIRGFEFLIDLIYKHKIISDKIDFMNSYNNMMVNFKNGDLAMIIQGPWATSDILSGKEFKGNPDNLGIIPIPKGPYGYGSPIGGNAYAISKSSRHPETAYQFINFINSKKAQALFVEKNNIPPTRESAYLMDEVKKNRILHDFKKQLDVATPRETAGINAELQPIINKFIQKAYLNKISAKDALKKVESKWEKVFKKFLKKKSVKKDK